MVLIRIMDVHQILKCINDVFLTHKNTYFKNYCLLPLKFIVPNVNLLLSVQFN